MAITIRTRATIAAAAVLASAASAHVALTSPNGGEVLLAGGQFEIVWQIAIPHNLENWDLAYRTEPGPDNWVSIVDDFEAGDSSAGSIHSFTWDVPNIIDDSVWVRVIMDNTATDYQDVSLEPFAIVPAPGSAAVFLGGALLGVRRRR